MKPIVHYDTKQHFSVIPGIVAYLTPIGHPRAELNGIEVRTSRVINYDEVTGQVETRNTIYKPYYELP